MWNLIVASNEELRCLYTTNYACQTWVCWKHVILVSNNVVYKNGSSFCHYLTLHCTDIFCLTPITGTTCNISLTKTGTIHCYTAECLWKFIKMRTIFDSVYTYNPLLFSQMVLALVSRSCFSLLTAQMAFCCGICWLEHSAKWLAIIGRSHESSVPFCANLIQHC